MDPVTRLCQRRAPLQPVAPRVALPMAAPARNPRQPTIGNRARRDKRHGWITADLIRRSRWPALGMTAVPRRPGRFGGRSRRRSRRNCEACENAIGRVPSICGLIAITERRGVELAIRRIAGAAPRLVHHLCRRRVTARRKCDGRQPKDQRRCRMAPPPRQRRNVQDRRDGQHHRDGAVGIGEILAVTSTFASPHLQGEVRCLSAGFQGNRPEDLTLMPHIVKHGLEDRADAAREDRQFRSDFWNSACPVTRARREVRRIRPPGRPTGAARVLSTTPPARSCRATCRFPAAHARA